jgi:hypothetical protein
VAIRAVADAVVVHLEDALVPELGGRVDRTRQLKWRGWSGERAVLTELAFQRADEKPSGG